MREDEDWMTSFSAAAEEMFPDNQSLAVAVCLIERARRNNLADEADILSTEFGAHWRAVFLATMNVASPETDGRRAATRFAPSVDADREKTIHNERVKLNATFLNSLQSGLPELDQRAV